MILRDIAESDYHYDDKTVGKWTLYQYRMYVCDRDYLKTTVTFSSAEEAVAYRKQRLEKDAKVRLRTFGFSNEETG